MLPRRLAVGAIRENDFDAVPSVVWRRRRCGAPCGYDSRRVEESFGGEDSNGELDREAVGEKGSTARRCLYHYFMIRFRQQLPDTRKPLPNTQNRPGIYRAILGMTRQEQLAIYSRNRLGAWWMVSIHKPDTVSYRSRRW
jgi:hypothetical protein